MHFPWQALFGGCVILNILARKNLPNLKTRNPAFVSQM